MNCMFGQYAVYVTGQSKKL